MQKTVLGGRTRTREMNSGSLWERTENELFGGKLALWAHMMLLMLLVFIDGTSLVQRGTLSCTPISISLANLPESIRFTMVLSRCIFIYLMFRLTSHRPPPFCILQVAWLVMGFIPRLDNLVLRTEKGFNDGNRMLTNECLRFFSNHWCVMSKASIWRF